MIRYALHTPALILRDAPASPSPHHEHLQRYFDTSYRVFLTALEDLARNDTAIDREKEAYLRSMLDAVLDARWRIQKEARQDR